MSAVGTTFNVFSPDAVWAEHRTHHLPDAEPVRFVLYHEQGFYLYDYYLPYFDSQVAIAGKVVAV